MRHPDPQVQWFASQIGRAQSEVGRVAVTSGDGTTRTVGPLVVTRTLEFIVPEVGFLKDYLGVAGGREATLVSQLEIYLLKSAVQVAALAKDTAPKDPGKALIFVEVEDPARPDLTSGRYFDIAAAQGYRHDAFQGDAMFVAGILGRALGVDRDGYDDLVRRAFKGSSALAFFGLGSLADAAATTVLDLLKPLVTRIA